MPMEPFLWRDKNCPLTLVCLWFPDQEGPVVVVRQHEQLCCFVPADAAKQPPEQRRKDKSHQNITASLVVQTRKKHFAAVFQLWNVDWNNVRAHSPTGGGLKLQQSKADVKWVERIASLFQPSVSTELKVTYTGTPPTWQGTPRPPRLSQHLESPVLCEMHAHAQTHDTSLWRGLTCESPWQCRWWGCSSHSPWL